MSTQSLLMTASVAALGLMPFAATAAPISSEASVTVTTGMSGSVPTATIDRFTAVEGDGSDGTSEVGVAGDANYAIQKFDGQSDVSAASFDGGFSEFELVTSQALLTQVETNTFGATRDYFLNFTLQGLTAELQHSSDQINGPRLVDVQDQVFAVSGFTTDTIVSPTATALPAQGTDLTAVNPFGEAPGDINASSVTAASFEYYINVNGQNVFSTRADAMVSFDGGEDVMATGEFENGAALTGSFLTGFQFSVDPILDKRISLGQFDADAEIKVESGLIARAYSHAGGLFVVDEERCFAEFEGGNDFPCAFFETNGVDSFFSDPITLSSIGSMAVPMPAVPLPAAGWMMIAGLGGMAAFGRRRKKS